MPRMTLTLVLFAVLLAVPRQASANPALCLENGHYYQAVAVSESISWHDARLRAESTAFTDQNGVTRLGHLATIASQEENNFIRDNLPEAIAGWYWLGAIQLPTGDEPAGGWTWVTEEPFIFTNWAPGEPNDVNGDEETLHFVGTVGEWNDRPGYKGLGGYVVEYEGANNSPPIADVGGPYDVSTSAVQAEVIPETLNLRSRGRWVTAYLTVEAGATATVQLDGTGSNDPDGDPLSYSWTIQDDEGNPIATAEGPQPMVELPVGTFHVELIVKDGSADSEAGSSIITVTLLDLALVDPASVTLCGPDEGPAVSGERGQMQDEETLMVKFSRSGLMATLVPDQPNLITVGGAVSGQDTIEVI